MAEATRVGNIQAEFLLHRATGSFRQTFLNADIANAYTNLTNLAVRIAPKGRPDAPTFATSHHRMQCTQYDKVRQSVTSKSKSKKHGLITGSDQNRSEPVRACDWSMLFAFAFARNTSTHVVIHEGLTRGE
jgi:hypothetical protein